MFNGTLPAWHPHVAGRRSRRTELERLASLCGGAVRIDVSEVAAECTSGSGPLSLVGAALHLFATTSMGIVMAMLAPSMPPLALLTILPLIPLQFLSGGLAPRESMPALVQTLMLAATTTHFTELSQAILYGAGLY